MPGRARPRSTISRRQAKLVTLARSDKSVLLVHRTQAGQQVRAASAPPVRARPTRSANLSGRRDDTSNAQADVAIHGRCPVPGLRCSRKNGPSIELLSSQHARGRARWQPAGELKQAILCLWPCCTSTPGRLHASDSCGPLHLVMIVLGFCQLVTGMLRRLWEPNPSLDS